MTTEREVLVVDNIALANYMANKYRDIPVEFEAGFVDTKTTPAETGAVREHLLCLIN